MNVYNTSWVPFLSHRPLNTCPFLKFSFVKIASLTTNQQKHSTLKSLFTFQTCFQCHSPKNCPVLFKPAYAEPTVKLPLLHLSPTSLSFCSVVPMKFSNSLKKSTNLLFSSHLRAWWSLNSNPQPLWSLDALPDLKCQAKHLWEGHLQSNNHSKMRS